MYEIDTKEIIEAKENESIMSKLITENSALIWSIVKRFIGRGYEKEDLYQIGCIGFIKSIKRFNPQYDVRLSTYAVPYILGEIKRFIRDDGPIKVSRSTKELLAKIKQIEDEYVKNGKELTIDIIAKTLKISKEEVAFALESKRPIESIDEQIYDDSREGETKLSQIKDERDETNNLVNKICINELIKELEKREQEIIVLRYYQNKTQIEVAKRLGISQVQVSRIEKKVLINLRTKIEA